LTKPVGTQLQLSTRVQKRSQRHQPPSALNGGKGAIRELAAMILGIVA
jgi:hypothetical protein